MSGCASTIELFAEGFRRARRLPRSSSVCDAAEKAKGGGRAKYVRSPAEFVGQEMLRVSGAIRYAGPAKQTVACERERRG
eukprot:936842-Alexandrium_andersonii.AAC.1